MASGAATIADAAAAPATPTTVISLNPAVNAPTKLDGKNFTAWKLQLTTLLTGHGLIGYVTGATPMPPPTTPSPTGDVTTNAAHLHWIHQDALIHNLLLGSVDKEFMATIQHTTNSKQAWDTLLDTYGKQSKGRIRHLRLRLHSITKGTMSISQYFTAVKTVADDLASLNAKVPDDDLVEIILKNLGSEYKDLVSAIQPPDDDISMPLLHEKLLLHEKSLLQSPSVAPPTYTAFPSYPSPRPMHVSPNTTYSPILNCLGPHPLSCRKLPPPTQDTNNKFLLLITPPELPLPVIPKAIKVTANFVVYMVILPLVAPPILSTTCYPVHPTTKQPLGPPICPCPCCSHNPFQHYSAVL